MNVFAYTFRYILTMPFVNHVKRKNGSYLLNHSPLI